MGETSGDRVCVLNETSAAEVCNCNPRTVARDALSDLQTRHGTRNPISQAKLRGLQARLRD